MIRIYSTLTWEHDQFCRLQSVQGELQIGLDSWEAARWDAAGDYRDTVFYWVSNVLRAMEAPFLVLTWKGGAHRRSSGPVALILTLQPEVVDPIHYEDAQEAAEFNNPELS